MIDKAYFDSVRKAKADGEPIAKYIKAIKGIVHVSVINTFTGKPEVISLKGDPGVKETPIEDISIFFWTEFGHDFFRGANKLLLEEGILASYTQDIVDEVSVNEVSDDILIDALGKKFFAVKALLDKFTSPVPVLRLLNLAEDMNKPIGTITAIKKRLSDLQQIEQKLEE